MNHSKYAGFVILKVLRTVLMKIQVFQELTPCRLVNSYQCFGGTRCLCFQGNFEWNRECGGSVPYRTVG
jgi:hypothetical protein